MMGHLLSPPNVMRCEKCRFATTDIADFKRHMAREHIEYYCFYCNSVSLSEAELQAHLKIHTATSPFKCPHCGQVYMRRMCLIKHIERFHNKHVPLESLKIDSSKTSHREISVSQSASQSLSSTVDSLPQRPAVRVTVPTPTATGVRLDSNFQRLKSRNSHLTNVSHSDAVPLNGHVQRNRALTVPLPEEVSIPAGCMVEVAEVKTVDGTKELRLRFVAHQEKESVIKNGRTTVPETSKLLGSHVKYQNTPSESERLTVTKNNETKQINKEPHIRIPVNVSKSLPNPSMKDQCRTTKRQSPPEVINLDAHVPRKLVRNFIPITDSKVATNIDPINHHNVTPSAMSSLFTSRIVAGSVQPENPCARICPRGVEERRGILERPSISTSIMANSAQKLSCIIPTNQAPVALNANDCILLQKNKQESTKPQQPSLKPQLHPMISSLLTSPQIRVSNECKDNFAPKTFFPQQDSSQKMSTEPIPAKKPSKTSNALLKVSVLPQEVKVEKTAIEGVQVEREGFPVISSVYSLSRQPEDPRESSQPIVMAEWTNSAGRDGLNIKSIRSEQLKITSELQPQIISKDGSLSQKMLPNKITCESVKVEQDQCVKLDTESVKVEQGQCVKVQTPETPGSINVKNDKSTSPKEKKKCKNGNKKQSPLKEPAQHSPLTEPAQPSPVKESAHTSTLSSTPSLESESVSSQNLEMENSSKFLTVCLKRVQVGIWEKSKKKRKTVISKRRPRVRFGGVKNCTVLQLLPLRKDQVVKCPSPNQPVVVLNHPKPSVHLKRGTLNFHSNKGTEVVPKCQILKMKLGKVTGQSYEVMGFTVQI